MPEGTYTMLKPTNGSPPWMELEPYRGAYYYADGGSVSTYKTVSAIIILPSSYRLKGTGLGRNAFISFGVSTGGPEGAIDIGIRNRSLRREGVEKEPENTGDAGFGWEPYCYECQQNLEHVEYDESENARAPIGTKRARVKVAPDLSDKQHISLSVEWLDASNRVIDASKNFSKNILLSRPFGWAGFYRFASLVGNPDNRATRSDSTYMLGGEFMDVKAGNSTWGISTSTVSKAWIVNHPKCQLPDGYWATGEQFRIDHWA